MNISLMPDSSNKIKSRAVFNSLYRPLDGAADTLQRFLKILVFPFFKKKTLLFLFCLSSLIIHLFFLDAKTTTNRTTAQIMYSVKSSLSGGGGRAGGERDREKCALE